LYFSNILTSDSRRGIEHHQTGFSASEISPRGRRCQGRRRATPPRAERPLFRKEFAGLYRRPQDGQRYPLAAILPVISKMGRVAAGDGTRFEAYLRVLVHHVAAQGADDGGAGGPDLAARGDLLTTTTSGMCLTT